MKHPMTLDVRARVKGLTCAGLLVAGCSAQSDAAVFRHSSSRISVAGAPGSAGPNTSPQPGLIPVTPSGPGGESAGANGCQPGHYVGSFAGTYNSAAWGNGILPLAVEAVPSLGRPGLEFWLERTEGDCAGVEFCADFTVKGGKIRGFANPFSDGDDGRDGDGFAIAVPFEIDFGGDLDCGRGQFRGLLQNGCYDVATILFRFEGTAPATYDQQTASFANGEWMVKEKARSDSLLPPDPSIGGMGSWSASLMTDGAMSGATEMGLCQLP